MKLIAKYGKSLAVMALLCSFLAAAPPAHTSAADVLNPVVQTGSGSGSAIDCSGAAKSSAVCAEHTTTENPVPAAIGKIINIVTYVAGAGAIIIIIVSGIRFMTADGDSSKIASARGTLINALIGIAIITLAGSLIKFVIHKL